MRLTLLFFLLLLIASSCYKDIDNTEVIEIITEQPKTDMETGLTGHVDEGELLPLDDYALMINDNLYEVPESHFYFYAQDLHKKGQLIEVLKDNVLVGVAYSYLIENDLNRLQIKTLPSQVTKMSTDGSVELAEGINLKVSLTDLINQNGQVNEEAISVNIVTMEEQSLLSQFGSSAYLKSGELVVLDSELGLVLSIDQNGEALDLKENAKAVFQMAKYQGKNLFVFNRDFEYWIEVGEIGSSDISVDQIGYYLIADSEPGVYSEGSVKSGTEAISYVNGSHDLDERSFPFISTEKGKWAQILPGTRGLETKYYDPCNKIIGTSDLTTTDIDVTNFESQLQDSNLFNISAEIVDCEGNNYSNPSMVIGHDQSAEDVYVFSGSSTERRIAVCNPEFSVTGYDLGNSDRGPSIPWNLENEDDLSYISNCSIYDKGYTYIKINDEVKVYPNFSYLSVSDETRFFSENATFEIKFKGNDKDFYASEEVNILINDPSIGKDGYYISCLSSESGCGISEFQVTHINEGGNGWIRASFKGVLWMRTIRNVVAGNFPIEGVILIKQ